MFPWMHVRVLTMSAELRALTIVCREIPSTPGTEWCAVSPRSGGAAVGPGPCSVRGLNE